MTINAHRFRFSRITIFILLILLAPVIDSRAAGKPDSIDAIQSVLPDSVSLEGKVVYVDFWASWCVPCRQSFPWMQKFYEQYRVKDFIIVAVNVDKDHSAALKFIEDNKATFPIVFDSTGTLAKQFELDAMPTSFIYNRNGKLVTRIQGFTSDEADSLDADILKLIREGGKK